MMPPAGPPTNASLSGTGILARDSGGAMTNATPAYMTAGTTPTIAIPGGSGVPTTNANTTASLTLCISTIIRGSLSKLRQRMVTF